VYCSTFPIKDPADVPMIVLGAAEASARVVRYLPYENTLAPASVTVIGTFHDQSGLGP
jgi:hypothetical protein